MQINGILETALSVSDIRKSADFYQRLFGFPTLLDSERLIALNVAGRNVLLLFLRGATEEPAAVPGGVIPPHGGSGRNHLAFSIASVDVKAWEQRLGSEGVVIEGTVDWPAGARSIYFRDPDENLVELITPGFWSIY